MKQLNLRIPDDLHVRLVEASERDRRSLNAEILWLLEQALGRAGAERRLGPRGD